MTTPAECLILTALNDEDLIQQFISELLEEGLILSACYWPVKVMYQWEGAMHVEDEYKVLMKTRQDRYAAVEEYIIEHHPYKAPEIIEVNAVLGSPSFRNHLMAQKTMDPTS
ncbi:MAG: divalent-cation tolerance protein CutA [Leptospiraceae bacterium]|nr:divalent-cation tolerance protein CutA [Leptospiraceae bacterium]